MAEEMRTKATHTLCSWLPLTLVYSECQQYYPVWCFKTMEWAVTLFRSDSIDSDTHCKWALTFLNLNAAVSHSHSVHVSSLRFAQQMFNTVLGSVWGRLDKYVLAGWNLSPQQGSAKNPFTSNKSENTYNSSSSGKDQWRIYIDKILDTPLLGPILFIFIRFPGKFGHVIGFAPPLWEILDPNLSINVF